LIISALARRRAGGSGEPPDAMRANAVGGWVIHGPASQAEQLNNGGSKMIREDEINDATIEQLKQALAELPKACPHCGQGLALRNLQIYSAIKAKTAAAEAEVLNLAEEEVIG